MKRMILKSRWIPIVLLSLISGCVDVSEISVSKTFPYANSDDKRDVCINVYSFRNFTDTPQAGMRAANIVSGVLSSKGYRVIESFKYDTSNLKKIISDTLGRNCRYLLIGGVSEWRYKTGIDGEPAVSLQMRLIGSKNGQVVWSAAGSKNNWGNASIGTTAQGLFGDMLK